MDSANLVIPKRITTRVARLSKQFVIICPHCNGSNTSLLPGGVVAECLDASCGWAFNAGTAQRREQVVTP